MEDWFLKAKELYKPGEFGYKQIAKKFNISPKTVESRFLREKRRGNIKTNGNGFELKADGSGISIRQLQIKDGEDMTPEFLIKAHGLDPSKWKVSTYTNNNWESQVKGGETLLLFQSKLTVKPIDEKYELTTEQIAKNFDELERIHKPMILLPKTQTGNLMAEVNIADLHVGRLCWHGDTGNNFDYKIARSVFRKIISDVYYELKGKPIEYILFPIYAGRN